MAREPETVRDLVFRLKVHHLKESLEVNKERAEAARCIEGLVEFIAVLVDENHQLKAEECPCKRREAELDMLFSEWNEEIER
jgi:hypothetical protein